MFGSKELEVTAELRKLHSGEFRHPKSSAVSVPVSRRIR
jgi:hypothetical protein